MKWHVKKAREFNNTIRYIRSGARIAKLDTHSRYIKKLSIVWKLETWYKQEFANIRDLQISSNHLLWKALPH